MNAAIDIAGLVIWTIAAGWMLGTPPHITLALSASAIIGYTLRWLTERRRSAP